MKAMRPIRRKMRRECEACSGHGALGQCDACEGRGFTHVRCAQHWAWLPVAEFIGARGNVVGVCRGCRDKYSNWEKRSPAEREAATNPRARLSETEPLRVSFVERSGNRKTGPIPVSMTSARTCPKSCALYGAGCYAEGHIIAMHWRRVSGGTGLTWSEFCARVASLPDGQVWRHNEAGDLPGDDGAIDAHKLAQLVLANGGKRGFTYTHKPQTPENADYIRGANQCGFVVNISADSLEAADDMAELGLPVVVTLPSGAGPKSSRTPAGRTVVVCPATIHARVTCESCKLCAVGHRKSIVGFPAHGDRKAQVTRRLVQLPMFAEARS